MTFEAFSAIFKDLLENAAVYRQNERKYLEKIQGNQENFMVNLLISCDLCVCDRGFSSAQRVLAAKFLKTAMDLRETRFVYLFQIHAIDTFYSIALKTLDKSAGKEPGELFFNESPGIFAIFAVFLEK